MNGGMRALVTGGTGRIGGAGAAPPRQEGRPGVAARLEQEGGQVLPAGSRDGDLARVDEVRALVSRAVAELGGLDLVVHAAGDGFVPRPVEEVAEADWDAAFAVTAKGSFFLAQAAAPHLREARGTLVLIEDVAAYQPWPSF